MRPKLSIISRRRRGLTGAAPLVPAALVEEGGVWYADTDPAAVPEGFSVNNPDYDPEDPDSNPQEVDTTALEGEPVYVRGGTVYLDDIL